MPSLKDDLRTARVVGAKFLTARASETTMQGVYYRRTAKAPWEFLGPTKSVGHAERKMRKRALETGIGVFVYLEGQNLSLTTWSLRNLGKIRLLARRIAKSFLPHYKPIRQSGRRTWHKCPPGQLSLPFVPKKTRQEKREMP